MFSYEDFLTNYQSKSTESLVEIISNPDDYQVAAVAAAQAVIIARNVGTDEIALWKKEIKDKKQQQAQTLADSKLKKRSSTVFSTGSIDGIQLQEGEDLLYGAVESDEVVSVATKKLIMVIAAAYAAIIIFIIYRNRASFLYLIESQTTEVYLYIALILPQLIILTGLILFALVRKAGWMMLAIISGLSVLNICFSIYNYLDQQFGGATTLAYRAVFPTSTIVILIFHIAVIYLLCSSRIKKAFQISPLQMQISFGISIVWGVMLLLIAAMRA